MNRKLSLFAVIVAACLGLAAGVAVTLAQGPQPAGAPNAGLAPESGVGPGFTYQGQLRKNGVAVNGACAIDFTLWNAPSAPSGSQIGSVQTLNPVSVTNGLFTVLLNAAGEFGPNAFTGDSRWLQADVKCPGDGAPVPLSRQLLSAAPYALSLRPGAAISAAAPYPGAVLSLTNSANGDGLYAYNGGGFSAGVHGTSVDGIGVQGESSQWIGVAGGSRFYDGVRGASGAAYGSGVTAFNVYITGTALKIEKGAIQVTNAGISTTTPVFIHQVVTGAGGNICTTRTYATIIDHPLTNADPNAILIVTPNYGLNSTGGFGPAQTPYAVFYDDNNVCTNAQNHWLIYSLTGVALNDKQMFNVLVIKP